MTMFAPYEPEPARRPPPFDGTLREARPEDIDVLARITAERHGTPLKKHVEGATRELSDPQLGKTRLLLVAEEGGHVLGYGRARHVEAMGEIELDLRPPAGWYLMGVVVAPPHQRRGVGRALTAARLDWIRERAAEAFYFTRRTNLASIDLHSAFGFRPHQERFQYPRTGLEPGDGMLYRVGF